MNIQQFINNYTDYYDKIPEDQKHMPIINFQPMPIINLPQIKEEAQRILQQDQQNN